MSNPSQSRRPSTGNASVTDLIRTIERLPYRLFVIVLGAVLAANLVTATLCWTYIEVKVGQAANAIERDLSRR